MSRVNLSQGSAAFPGDEQSALHRSLQPTVASSSLPMVRQWPATTDHPYRSTTANTYQRPTVSAPCTMKTEPDLRFSQPILRRFPTPQYENQLIQDLNRAILRARMSSRPIQTVHPHATVPDFIKSLRPRPLSQELMPSSLHYRRTATHFQF